MVRGVLFGVQDLQNPWGLALALVPGDRSVVLRTRASSNPETYTVPASERRAFIRALACTVLDKDLRPFLAPPRSRAGATQASEIQGKTYAPPRWIPLLERFMAGRYSWEHCPAPIRFRIDRLIEELAGSLDGQLIGLYLHGSLTMGSFNPRWSDVDLLGVMKEPMDEVARKSAAEALLRHSRPPRGIEAMFIAEQQLRVWEYPTPYQFYFSEKVRRAYEADLQTDAWRTWFKPPKMSYYLAAHIPEILKRGRTLFGRPIAETFRPIPEEYNVAAIMRDFRAKRERLPATTISGVLNACRVYAHLSDGGLYSKEEAAVWAMRILPVRDRKIVRRALEVYRGYRTLGERFDAREVARFFDELEPKLVALAARNPRALTLAEAPDPVGAPSPGDATPP